MKKKSPERMKFTNPLPEMTAIGCPFCSADGEAIFLDGFTDDEGRDGYRLTCINCNACGPRSGEIKEAYVSWNFRGGEPLA